jgi:predicted transcriptional regulator
VYPLVQADEKASLLHRSRIDIIANILRVAEGGAKKTHIMYKCNLSFKQLHVYLDFMVERGLLECSSLKTEGKADLTTTYKATKEGRAFIQAYRNLRALLST